MMIGHNIQRIRMEKNMTLTELAERAQISKSYLSNIERKVNQNPSIQVLERIALVLGVDFKQLVGMEPTDDHIHEDEWIEFVNELKKSGIKKEQLQEFKTVIEFAKWQNSKRKGS